MMAAQPHVWTRTLHNGANNHSHLYRNVGPQTIQKHPEPIDEFPMLRKWEAFFIYGCKVGLPKTLARLVRELP